MPVKTDSPLRKTKRRPLRRRAPGEALAGPIRLDPFQEEAFKLLAEGHNILVAAPTGTGKTLIAEMLIEKVLADGRGIVYTSPIKALSNQKYRDFAGRFGKERVGLITGDVSVNERAPLLVMTTEIFRNWCFASPEMLDDMTHVIFDELHYLDDRERGTAWEESIIFAPSHIRIVGLSATVPNVHELSSWIADVRGQPVKVVEERRRAVPLELSWITPEGRVLDEDGAREHIRQRIERRRGRWTDFPKNGAGLAYE
ncbi:MAG: DEAD/DEAH box helicase [Peptococcaceae bacterium]|nr:DEAD/DEAH box helicase [Peptococcaceae bacterium]